MSISSERLEKFQRCAYDNIKSHKKQGFTLSLENPFLEKNVSNYPPLPSLFRIKLSSNFNVTEIYSIKSNFL